MKNLQTFLANFNVVILLVGYQVFTAVFEAIFDVDSELSQSFTVPYRAFTLAVSLLCIVVSLKVKALRAPGTLFLWLVWICILSRFVDTMYFSQYSPNTSYVLTTWLYMIGLTLIPMYSVYKSMAAIDIGTVFKWTYILLSIAILLTYFTNTAYQTANLERFSVNAAIGIIGSGHLGLTGLLLSIVLIARTNRKTQKLFAIAISILSMLIMLRSASRGPVMALLGIGAFYIIARSKYKVVGIVIMALIMLGYTLFETHIINVLEEVAPMMKVRLLDRETAHFASRSYHYEMAVHFFNINPIFGSIFAIPVAGGFFIYAHNLFLDIAMQSGILGLGILLSFLGYALKACYRLIRRNSGALWISLLFLQSFFMLIVSGAIYTDPQFSILGVMILVFGRKGAVWQNEKI